MYSLKKMENCLRKYFFQSFPKKNIFFQKIKKIIIYFPAKLERGPRRASRRRIIFLLFKKSGLLLLHQKLTQFLSILLLRNKNNLVIFRKNFSQGVDLKSVSFLNFKETERFFNFFFPKISYFKTFPQNKNNMIH